MVPLRCIIHVKHVPSLVFPVPHVPTRLGCCKSPELVLLNPQIETDRQRQTGLQDGANVSVPLTLTVHSRSRWRFPFIYQTQSTSLRFAFLLNFYLHCVEQTQHFISSNDKNSQEKPIFFKKRKENSCRCVPFLYPLDSTGLRVCLPARIYCASC